MAYPIRFLDMIMVCSIIVSSQLSRGSEPYAQPVRGSLLVGLLVAALIAAPCASAEPTDNGYNGAPTIISGGPVPTMNGVPCVGGHLGTCTGFAQNQPRPTRPRSSVGHSPTVSP
jgi:hypothetical protein